MPPSEAAPSTLSRAPARERSLAPLIHAWGIGGLVAILLDAIVRLYPVAAEPVLAGAFSGLEWGALVVTVVFFAVAEGYKGFQRAFAPRAAGRALWLAENPRADLVALAPLFCMGLVGATRRRLFINWTLVVAIVAIVLGLRLAPAHGRAIVDAGVVVGLSWGTVAVVVFYVRGLLGAPPAVDLELSPGAIKPRPDRR